MWNFPKSTFLLFLNREYREIIFWWSQENQNESKMKQIYLKPFYLFDSWEENEFNYICLVRNDVDFRVVWACIRERQNYVIVRQVEHWVMCLKCKWEFKPFSTRSYLSVTVYWRWKFRVLSQSAIPERSSRKNTNKTKNMKSIIFLMNKWKKRSFPKLYFLNWWKT